MAVLFITLTDSLRQHGDGLLRTNTGCTGPSCSTTLYVDWLKLILITTKLTSNDKCNKYIL